MRLIFLLLVAAYVAILPLSSHANGPEKPPESFSSPEPKEPKTCLNFGWQVGEWWVLTCILAPPGGLEMHNQLTSHFYFRIDDTTHYEGQKAFVVEIYCRKKAETEQYLALRGSQKEGTWPDNLQRCSKEDLTAGFPLVAKLYVALKDYSALGIEYSDSVKARVSEYWLKQSWEDLKNKGLLSVYHLDAKRTSAAQSFILCYPSKEDLLEELIVHTQDEDGPDPLYRRYLLIKGEPWVYKQETLRKCFAVDRFETRGLVFLSDSLRSGQNEPTIFLNPSVKPNNLRKTLGQQSDSRGIDVFRVGSGFEQVDLNRLTKMMTRPPDWRASSDNISCKSLSMDTEEGRRLKKKIEKLLAQEPAAARPEKERPDSATLVEKTALTEGSPNWILVGLIATAVGLVSLVIFLLLRRRR